MQDFLVQHLARCALQPADATLESMKDDVQQQTSYSKIVQSIPVHEASRQTPVCYPVLYDSLNGKPHAWPILASHEYLLLLSFVVCMADIPAGIRMASNVRIQFYLGPQASSATARYGSELLAWERLANEHIDGSDESSPGVSGRRSIPNPDSMHDPLAPEFLNINRLFRNPLQFLLSPLHPVTESTLHGKNGCLPRACNAKQLIIPLSC